MTVSCNLLGAAFSPDRRASARAQGLGFRSLVKKPAPEAPDNYC